MRVVITCEGAFAVFANGVHTPLAKVDPLRRIQTANEDLRDVRARMIHLQSTVAMNGLQWQALADTIEMVEQTLLILEVGK